MRRHRRNPVANPTVFALLLMLAALLPHQRGAVAEEASHPLQLEVYINDSPTKLIGSFTQFADGKMAAKRSELKELGLKVPGEGAADELVVIDQFPDMAYRYDVPTQKIYFRLGDGLRMTKIYDVSNGGLGGAVVRTDVGGVLNYNLFTTTNNFGDPHSTFLGGTSLTLDGRLFSPYGTFSQSAILRTSFDQQFEAIRLNSTFAYSDQGTLMTYRAGDTITGGLAWTRPIRIGGVQAQRNFGLRPDLITLPLRSVTGTAAVPSTVDVYINNLKTYSQDVGTGPYQITNIPVVTGAGSARVVLRDASGHETVTTQAFYVSPTLLAPGLYDFSLESGLPRLSFGSSSDTYVSDPVGSATLRGGIYDWLTVEAHAEGGSGLVNGGAGAVVRLGSTGVMSAAVAGSTQSGNTGLQSYLAFETMLRDVKINASTQRTFGGYDDLASVTARSQPVDLTTTSGFAGFIPRLTDNITSSSLLLGEDTRPPKRLDRISVGLPPLFFDVKSTLSASFVNLVHGSGLKSKIASMSWSRPLSDNASVFATAFSDFGDQKNTGIFAGLSIQFGGVSTTTSVSSNGGHTNGNFEAVKPLQEQPGSYGWRIRDSEGAAPFRFAEVSYRPSFARVTTNVTNSPTGTNAAAEIDGAIATLGKGVFFSNRIDDAFAVVDAGAPDVDVLYENRPAGRTNSQGQLLLPRLRSYQKNKISIDPRDLPIDAEAPAVQNVVAPGDRSGIVVSFGVKTNIKAAVVVLKDKTGKLMPPGTAGKLEGGDDFVVGYDGRAYIKGLSTTNTVVVSDGTNECRASFPFEAKTNTQIVIGPVTCQ